MSNKEWPTTSNNFCPMCGHSEIYHGDEFGCTYVVKIDEIEGDSTNRLCGCKKLMEVGVR